MLLFARVDVLGVAWLRIAAAALVFAALAPARGDALDATRTVLAWGAVLAVMNCCFYTAIDRLPLGTVAAIEFLPVIVLAALGARTPRNAAALALAVPGVYLLTGVHLAGEPLGVAFAFANAALFAPTSCSPTASRSDPAIAGIDGLGAAMLVALVVVTPIAGWAALPALRRPGRARWPGIGVGISSSVIPYVADQLAMARLPRATYALMVSLLPATATVIGLVVLAQVPSLDRARRASRSSSRASRCIARPLRRSQLGQRPQYDLVVRLRRHLRDHVRDRAVGVDDERRARPRPCTSCRTSTSPPTRRRRRRPRGPRRRAA